MLLVKELKGSVLAAAHAVLSISYIAAFRLNMHISQGRYLCMQSSAFVSKVHLDFAIAHGNMTVFIPCPVNIFRVW